MLLAVVVSGACPKFRKMNLLLNIEGCYIHYIVNYFSFMLRTVEP